MMALASAGLRAAGNTALARPLGTHGRTFPARRDQVRGARLFMAGILAGGPLADDAVLCVSELASNCVVRELASEVGIGGDALTGWAVWARPDGPARRPWARLR